jgi:hypothetical protein
MAETPVAELAFRNSAERPTCYGCGGRVISIPGPLPDAGDDFDWRVRDYDGFRQFMLEELAARFPERTRWTPADMEVVIIEVLSAVLDQLSDMADRVFAEAFLETARRPDSVRRLLGLIGYDAAAEADALDQIAVDESTSPQDANALLEKFWARHPFAMDQARQAGPLAIRTQHRMVTVGDYAERMEEHPLVLRAHAWTEWTGSWETINVAIIPWDTALSLDLPVPQATGDPDAPENARLEQLKKLIERFNERRRIPLPDWTRQPTIRTVLLPYLERYRMTGQEVILRDAVPVGVTIILSIVVKKTYFRSEVAAAAAQALGKGPSAFFEPGRLRFGEDLFASDVVAALMQLDGVENICLIRFKRTGSQFTDQSDIGRIVLEGLELAVCDSDPAQMQRGYLVIKTHGGRGA